MLGDEAQRADTAAALESASGVLRSEVGRQTGVRRTPSLDVRRRRRARRPPSTSRSCSQKVAAADAEVLRAAAEAKYAGEPDPYRAPRTEAAEDVVTTAEPGWWSSTSPPV